MISPIFSGITGSRRRWSCESACPAIPPVLVDTNVILECWRVGSWRALAGGYHVETVGDCVTETQTGFQRRRPERRIGAAGLRQSLARVHDVTPAQLAAVIVRDETISFLDVGERSLWAHALTRTDAWVLCGPDRASLQFGIRLGFRDRLVALERLLSDVGARPRQALRPAYTTRWLDTVLAELSLLEGGRRR
jgi:hypothetical protein